MAAGFLILRLLLFWLLSDVTHSNVWQRADSGYRKAWQDGGKKQVPSYGHRRPLHYVRTLRQPIGHTRTWQKPQGFMRPLGHAQMQRQMSTRGRQTFPAQTIRQRSYPAPQRSYPAPQRSYPLARPKSFQINLDIPFLNLEDQNKKTDSVAEGYDYSNYNAEPGKKTSVQNVQSGFEASQFIDPGNKVPTKYPSVEKTSNEVPMSSIQLNFTIPFLATSLNPLKSNVGHAKSQTKQLNSFVQNRYKEPEKQELGLTQTGSKWFGFNQVGQEPTQQQTGLKWPDYNQVAQEPTQQQTGLKWPDYNQVAQEPTQQQTGLKWPDYNQVAQEPTQQQTLFKWPDYNQVAQEPTQQQTGLKWPDYNQVAQEPTQQQAGSKWSIFNRVDPGPQTQQTYLPVYKEPSDNKPVFSSWHWSQNKNPQQVGTETSSKRLSWGLQKPDATKPASSPAVKYIDNLDVYGPQTSSSEEYSKESFLKPDIIKLHFPSPLQFNRYLSGGSDLNKENTGTEPVYQIQGNFRVPGTNFKDLTESRKEESTHETSVPNIKLGFSFPILSKLSNITQTNSGYLVNIEPKNTGSFNKESAKAQSEPPQTASKWPIFSFEHAKHQKPKEQPENKWPLLNLDAVLQQTKQPSEPVYSKPTDGKQTSSSWHASQPVNQHKTLTGQSWGVKKTETNKPQSPIHSISKYIQLPDIRRPFRKDKDQAVQPKPSQPALAQNSQYSSWVKPSSNTYAQGQTTHSGNSPFTFASKLDNLLKPAIVHEQSSNNPQIGFDLSFEFPNLDAPPASTKPQKWQKETFPHLFQYNSGRKASETLQTPHFLSTGYQREKEFSGQDTEHNRDRKGKYGKLFTDTDGGDGVFDRQSSFHAPTHKYPAKWSGRNPAGMAWSLRSPSCDSSSSSSEQGSFPNQFNSPYLNKKPQSGVGKCPNKPEKYEQPYNVQVNYSPSAETTAVSVPSNSLQPILSGSISHPIPSVFHLKQYNVRQI
ncbi:uncharacterized protein LOC108243482 [Kryptolebias marmoratus]|uniref:uncharacterized protein LOC108243482 n=1 Tax=Kryptolebias marmoratus TaxID=37003 RepID=UPI0007F901D8|nr:uncharacterized protein LOC108243482 [Kryptolebias marmoratus]